MGSIGVVDSGLIELVGEVRGESADLCRFLPAASTLPLAKTSRFRQDSLARRVIELARKTKAKANAEDREGERKATQKR